MNVVLSVGLTLLIPFIIGMGKAVITNDAEKQTISDILKAFGILMGAITAMITLSLVIGLVWRWFVYGRFGAFSRV